MSRRRRTTPTENAAIGPKSGLTAIAPTTIGAESIRTATDAIAPASDEQRDEAPAEEPLLRDPLADGVPDDGVGRRSRGPAASPRAPRVETDASRCSTSIDAALRDPELAQVADDEAGLLVGDVARDDVARRDRRAASR